MADMQNQINSYYRQKIEEKDDASLRLVKRAEAPVTSSVQTIHIIGICGTAMGSLAGLLREAGYEVTGSDDGFYPPMSTMLEELGIDIAKTGSTDLLNAADVVVVGNAAGPSHVEVAYAREHNLPLMSLPEALQQFIFGARQRLAVCGTHGKTTTTGLLASIFKAAKRDPGFLIGGVMQGQTTGFSLGKKEGSEADVFVLEGDEYDTAYFDKRPKFLSYAPHSAIITSVELDHVDIYRDLEDYKQAFRFLASQLPAAGTLIACGDDALVREVISDTAATVVAYGLGEENDVMVKSLESADGVQRATLIEQGEVIGEIHTTLPGVYNLLNATAAALLARAHGVSFEDIQQGISNFRGMKRRQEIVFDGTDATGQQVTLIDDFAHHPHAVTVTLAGLRARYTNRRLIAIFEPRSNSSRKKIFETAYTQSFDDADQVLLKMPPLRHNDSSEDFMNVSSVAKEITKRGTPTAHVETVEELIETLEAMRQPDDVIVMMSNGSFDGLREKLIAMFEGSA
jgi:UDP-N-acetylmuramate: L-alanyl-gamma-D-glutamyl-meso-diaminopimelate ligase